MTDDVEWDITGKIVRKEPERAASTVNNYRNCDRCGCATTELECTVHYMPTSTGSTYRIHVCPHCDLQRNKQ